MPSEVKDLISDFSRFYILTILYEEPAHGYSIIIKFRKRIGKEISPCLVYPFLKQLEQKGLLEHTIKSVGKKERKVFELTAEGRELYKIVQKIRQPNLNSLCTKP